MAKPKGIPRSKNLLGLRWLGARVPHPAKDIHGDTFPLTWADDDEIYTSSGDPQWGANQVGLDTERFSGGPTDYTIHKLDEMLEYKGPGGGGPKPSGMICVDGVLYLAFQNQLGYQRPLYGQRSQHGSDASIVSTIFKGGQAQWVPAFGNLGDPMFPGHRFGGPAFVNFGKNNANARDGYVYAVSSDQWDNGSNLRLGRVPKGRIVHRGAWEWVAAFTRDGQPYWSSELDEAIPVLSLHGCLGLPEMVHVAALKRYLLFTWRLKGEFSGHDGSELFVLEAPEPWGPFSLVHHEPDWEDAELTPYCPRLPLKWLEPSGTRGWLQFSGTWESPGHLHYRSHVRAFELVLR